MFGIIEMPLLVKDYLARMSRGELLALLSCAMATVARHRHGAVRIGRGARRARCSRAHPGGLAHERAGGACPVAHHDPRRRQPGRHRRADSPGHRQRPRGRHERYEGGHPDGDLGGRHHRGHVRVRAPCELCPGAVPRGGGRRRGRSSGRRAGCFSPWCGSSASRGPRRNSRASSWAPRPS